MCPHSCSLHPVKRRGVNVVLLRCIIVKRHWWTGLCQKMSMMLQDVERPNTTPIGQDRKFKFFFSQLHFHNLHEMIQIGHHLFIKTWWTSHRCVENQSELLKVLTGQLSHFLAYVASVRSPSVYTVCPKRLIDSSILSFETFPNDYQVKIIGQIGILQLKAWRVT